MSDSDGKAPRAKHAWNVGYQACRRWLPILFAVALCPASAQAQDIFEQEEFGLWWDSYYKSPNPEQVARALRTIDAKGLYKDEHTFAPLNGFFGEVFAANPERIDGWIEPFIGRDEPRFIRGALWFADCREARKALHRLAQASTEADAAEIVKYMSEPPPAIGSRPVQSPADLDFLWGRFCASGNALHVRRVIDQLELKRDETDGRIQGMGYAAEWSLAGMGSRHERVLQVIQEEARKREGDMREDLENVLARIEEIKSEESDSPGTAEHSDDPATQ